MSLVSAPDRALAAETINKSGQTLGRKGLETRARIIETTVQLLDESRGLPPPLLAVARSAKISPPTFYLYFTDVADVIYAAVEGIGESLTAVAAALETPWTKGEAYSCALSFIDAFFAYWSANSSVLRARNRLADEGSVRFVESRMQSVDRLRTLLAARIRPAEVNGVVVASPEELAGTMLTSIERIATITVLNLYPSRVDALRSGKQALAYQLSLLAGD